MRSVIGVLAAFTLGLFLIAPAMAVEPYLDFVRGLRERQFYDVALEYLDQIAKDPKLPAEVKPLLPYEKALTLMEGARQVKNLEQQTKQLDQAEAFLEQFVKESPNHELAGQANTQRAEILLGKARVEVMQAKSPANTGNRAQFQTKARELIGKAKAIFKAALDLHEAAWKAFPTFIDPDKDRDQFEARKQAEVNFIKAQLDMALTTYEEAQTYDAKSADYKTKLTEAAKEFETMHSKYRSQVGGLFSRMWQGKCFEEQEDLGKALGIYNELLDHPGDSATMRNLQDQVLQFRLICLNHPDRSDHELVAIQANEWLAKPTNKARTRTLVGLGIRWEKARAEEAIALRRDTAEKDKEKSLRQALVEAKAINQFPGPYKDVSTFMIQRINAALGKAAGDPKDFDGALGLGRNMIKQIKELQDAVTAAKRGGKAKEELTKAETDLDTHLKETARILKLALNLSEPDTPLDQLNSARHLLSYVYYLNRNSFEAAILAEFIAKRYPEEELALESAYIAMAAWQQAYYALPKEASHEVEMSQMIRVCNLIAKNWATSDRANEARLTLGQLYSDAKQPVESAKWYGQVPESASQYASAQIAAGQAYWTAYLESAFKPEGQRPPEAELKKWGEEAGKHLATGIAKIGTTVTKDNTPPDEMVAAQVSLAQIRIAAGQFAESIKILVGEPHPVVKSIEVKENEPRPAKGIKSKAFYVLTYQLLLRSYVGTQDIEKALAAMAKLEALAGGPQSPAVLEIYIELGKAIEQEMKVKKAAGDEKGLADLRSSFNKFLDEVYKRKDTMSYNGLTWVAETYYALGNGSEGDKATASGYFNKASATYADTIAKAEKGTTDEDKQFAAGPRMTGIRLRLVNCKRREGDFPAAMDLIATVLKSKPNALEAQFEAAYVLQDWGMSGQGDSYKKLLEAINGPADGALKEVMWGWGKAALRLQRIVEAGKAQGDQMERYYEAGYNQTWSRFQYGKAQSSTPARLEEYAKARQEIEAFVSVAGKIPDNDWEKFDKLFRDIQKEENPTATPVALARPVSVAPSTANEVVKKPTAAKPEEKKTASTSTAAKKPEGGLGTGVIVALLVVCLAAIGGMIFMMMKPKPKRRSTVPDEAPVMPVSAPRPAKAKVAAGSAGGVATAAAPPARKESQPGAARPAAKPAAGAPGTKPAAKPPAAGTKPPTKPST